LTAEFDAVLDRGQAMARQGRIRRWAFHVVLAAALLLIAVPMAPFLVIPVAWPFLVEQLGDCLVHDVGVATLLWWMVAGLLAQFRGARRQVGAMQQLFLVVMVMLGLTALTRPASLLSPMLLFFGLTVVVGALHPARAELVRLRSGIEPYIAGLALIAAGPFLAYAVGQLRLESSTLTPATHGGHWTTMATVAILVIFLALLAALRPRGWRVLAWSAGVAALLFGVAGAAQPNLPSSIEPAWGALAAAWGVIFVTMTEWRYRRRS
jgi:hypothetical protein